jgi:hypothetical protein
MIGAEFGDKRLSARLPRIVQALALNPSEGLPKALRSEAALEAAYRFMANARVTPDRILAPHLNATCRRAIDAGVVLAVHDTTDFEFGGETRRKIGWVSEDRAGFFAHVTLALSATEGALGLLNFHSWSRTHVPVSRKVRKTYAYQQRAPADKESDRWRQAVAGTEERVGGRARIIHVMDREGDQFRVLTEVASWRSDFVIRASHLDRVLAGCEVGHQNLRAAARAAPTLLERDVHLSRRHKSDKSSRLKSPHSPRDARSARLHVAVTTVVLRRSWGISAAEAPARINVNVVRVFEIDPPAGEKPVEWVLLTSLPIETPDDVAFIVDCYRSRWIIEEFFKAVKTGCQYERLQLESKKTLTNALAMILPVAWQMLLLRHVSRSDDKAPATSVFTDAQIDVLRNVAPLRLPRRPTVREALLAVAALGGHIKNNGAPGWLVLYRGFRDLTLLEIGWSTGRRIQRRETRRSDQS